MGALFQFFAHFMTFSTHRGGTLIGECNADAIRKQLKMANWPPTEECQSHSK